MTTQEFIDECNRRGHYPDCPVHEDVTTEKCCALRYAVEQTNERDAEVERLREGQMGLTQSVEELLTATTENDFPDPLRTKYVANARWCIENHGYRAALTPAETDTQERPMECPHCGIKNHANARGCSCGFMFKPEREQEAQAPKFCKDCLLGPHVVLHCAAPINSTKGRIPGAECPYRKIDPLRETLDTAAGEIDQLRTELATVREAFAASQETAMNLRDEQEVQGETRIQLYECVECLYREAYSLDTPDAHIQSYCPRCSSDMWQGTIVAFAPITTKQGEE